MSATSAFNIGYSIFNIQYFFAPVAIRGFFVHLNQLKQALTKAVYAYKHGRPHNNLPQRLTHVKFEERLDARLIKAPIRKLYKHEIES